MGISLCMIVKNEEENLERCLESVKDLADEIIVVDTGSTDGTAALAKRFGARVFHFPWNDSFADARNESLSKATGDWILIMDADDELEPGGRDALLALAQNGTEGTDIYCCQTLCYSGARADPCNVMINMNIRLIRNGKGYRYRGRIHEQLVRGVDSEAGPLPMTMTNIRFHHYGYLRSQIEKKEKHKRNMELIGTELAEDPENGFMRFNMGNEYFSMGDMEKALEYYLPCYRKIQPVQGYASILVIRVALCCEALGREEELHRYLKEGLRLFPKLTDLEYIRGDALRKKNRLLSAVRSYRKCLRMGEPPPDSNSMCGVGTFKPHYALAELYQRLGERKPALRHCREAIRFHPLFREAYARMADLLLSDGLSPERVKARLLRLAPQTPAALLMLSDLFYDRRLYRQALGLAGKAGRLEPENPAARYDEGACRFCLGQYRRAYRSLLKASAGEAGERADFLRLICLLLDPTAACASPAGLLLRLDVPHYAVARACRSLLAGETCAPLSDDPEGSKPYEEPIFALLEILLRAERLDEFIKALQLLNLISDEGVLLRLGKLYYKYGYLKLAYRELDRSFRLTGRIDAEGLAIMNRSIAAAG